MKYVVASSHVCERGERRWLDVGVQSPTDESMDRNLEAAPIARSRGDGPALGAATGVRDREPWVTLAARGDTVAQTQTPRQQPPRHGQSAPRDQQRTRCNTKEVGHG